MTALKIAALTEQWTKTLRLGCDRLALHADLLHGWFLNDEHSPSARRRDELLASMEQEIGALSVLLDEVRANVAELSARRDER